MLISDPVCNLTHKILKPHSFSPEVQNYNLLQNTTKACERDIWQSEFILRVDHNWPFLPTWSLLKHHIRQILQVDEENESSDPKQQQKPEGAGRLADGPPHPPPTAKTIHHLTIHEEHHSSDRRHCCWKREKQTVNTEEETSLLVQSMDGTIQWCCSCSYMYALSKASYNAFKFIHSLGNNLGVIGMMQKNFSQY